MLETVLMEYSENEMPYCVKNCKVKPVNGTIVYEMKGHYQTVNRLILNQAIEVSELVIELEQPRKNMPASLFEIEVH